MKQLEKSKETTVMITLKSPNNLNRTQPADSN